MGLHGIPDAVHADRGTSMTSKPVAQLMLDLAWTAPTPDRTSPTTTPTARRRSRP
jgi:hypothetical protein